MTCIKISTCCMLFTLSLVSPTAAGEVRGIVSKFSAEKNELVVEGRGLRMRGLTFDLVLSPETQFRVGLKPGKVADLAVGKRVQVLYEARDGKKVATLVTVNALLSGSPAPAPAAAAVPADPDTLIGTLRRIDFTEREIVVVSAAAKEETLPVAETAMVTREQKVIAFDDLKEGEQATVRFETKDGKKVATSIQIGPAATVPSANNRAEKLGEVMKLVEELLRRFGDGRGGPP